MADNNRWLKIFWISVVVAYALMFLLFFNRVGITDNDQFLTFHSLQYWNSQLFGIAEPWCPVLCGGISIGADPLIPKLSDSGGVKTP